jgi:N-acetylglucosaminyl-diphospho-decaprenol L-rhamnosyltransferase
MSASTASDPDLTVVVIAHDVRDEVLTCLESLERHQGGVRYHAVLVDNASRDGTADAVRERHPDVEVVRLDTNEGLPARNHGLRRARGRHRMFIDSDAAVTPGALPTLVETLDEDPGIGLVGPRLVHDDGSLQLSCRRYPPLLLPVLRRPPLGRFFEDGPTIRHHLMADAPYDRPRDVEYVLGACMVFSEAAQRAAGEIDERIWFGHDDADWSFKIRLAGLRIRFDPRATVIHRYRRTSASNPLSMHSVRQMQAHVHFQRKWWSQRARLRAEGRRMDDEALAERAEEFNREHGIAAIGASA